MKTSFLYGRLCKIYCSIPALRLECHVESSVPRIKIIRCPGNPSVVSFTCLPPAVPDLRQFLEVHSFSSAFLYNVDTGITATITTCSFFSDDFPATISFFSVSKIFSCHHWHFIILPFSAFSMISAILLPSSFGVSNFYLESYPAPVHVMVLLFVFKNSFAGFALSSHILFRFSAADPGKSYFQKNFKHTSNYHIVSAFYQISGCSKHE